MSFQGVSHKASLEQFARKTSQFNTPVTDGIFRIRLAAFVISSVLLGYLPIVLFEKDTEVMRLQDGG